MSLLLQIRHQPTTAYHPQANGMVERLHCHLKNALLACGATTTWAAELPWVLLGLRSTPRRDTNISPAQAFYGTPLVLPNQCLSINNEQTMNEFIFQIEKIKKNLPMTRHNTAVDQELPEDLPRSCGPRTTSGSAEVATRHPSRPSTTAPTPSSSAASATSGSSWATGRTTSPPPASSPAPAGLPSPWRPRQRQHHPGAAGPAGNCPPPPRCKARTLKARAHATASGS
jgi:hypothetical protein